MGKTAEESGENDRNTGGSEMKCHKLLLMTLTAVVLVGWVGRAEAALMLPEALVDRNSTVRINDVNDYAGPVGSVDPFAVNDWRVLRVNQSLPQVYVQ